MLRRRLVVAGLGVTLLLAAAPQAAAERDRPPNAKLIVGDTVQRGSRHSYCWGEFCGETVGYAFPEPRRVPAGRSARIRIWSDLPIRRADLDGWRRARPTVEGPEPAGRELDLKIGVHPVVREGELRGRVVTFRLPQRPGDLWLDLTIRWPNDDLGRRRSASYSFALELT